MRRRLACARTNDSRVSVAASPQRRRSDLSYSRASGTETAIRHRGSPTIRSSRFEAPFRESMAETSTLVSSTTRNTGVFRIGWGFDLLRRADDEHVAVVDAGGAQRPSSVHGDL